MWSFLKPKKRAQVAQPVVKKPTVALVPDVMVPATATSAGVTYDANLIEKLKGEHAEMLAVYTRILLSASAGRIDAIAEDLIAFRRLFQGHILLENVRFYVYLDRLLADHPSEREGARTLRKDMNGIAKAVAEFIYHWSSVAPTNETLPAFTAQLQGIGAALVARIELEESTLYTLYAESL
jgi:hypothetical protein